MPPNCTISRDEFDDRRESYPSRFLQREEGLQAEPGADLAPSWSSHILQSREVEPLGASQLSRAVAEPDSKCPPSLWGVRTAAWSIPCLSLAFSPQLGTKGGGEREDAPGSGSWQRSGAQRRAVG